MAILNCHLVAIEGAHGTGKSTLVHAVVARLKSQHLLAGSLPEVARDSPFVEQVVLYGKGSFNLAAEIHLFASQMAIEQTMARHHDILLCDKTVLNVLGYCALLLGEGHSATDRCILETMRTFAAAYARQYDAIFFAGELYDVTKTNDPFRPRDRHFQVAADGIIRKTYSDLGISYKELPSGLSLDEKTEWICARLGLAS